MHLDRLRPPEEESARDKAVRVQIQRRQRQRLERRSAPSEMESTATGERDRRHVRASEEAETSQDGERNIRAETCRES
jgi:hypothetical protein